MQMFPDARILIVDLENEKTEIKILPGEIYRLYPGGSALGTYLMLTEMKPKVDPLSPENVLVFSVSPLVGLPISGLNRINVTTKSPLTGTIADSQSGGFFPANFKANGWDAVVFKGRAKKPVYIYIDGENVQIKDAEKIWGKVTGDAEKIIREELAEENLEVAQIGPAGEKLVRFACIINMSNRANGRNGTGAVMGSKNLKAIVIKKKKALQPFNKEGFKELAQKTALKIRESALYKGMKENGTNGGLEWFSNQGYLATNNWTSGYFPKSSKITGQTFTDTILKKRDSCFGCAVHCKRVVEIEGKVDPLYGGPEYETCATMGSYCGVEDIEAVSLANQLCNMYGMDTISCGATIAFAMECYQQGLIDKNSTDGIELNFGNSEALINMIEKIANREGLGHLLAEGSEKAAAKIGNNAADLLITVKGQELPAHMPQWKAALGLIYAVNPFGADHQSSDHDPSLSSAENTKDRANLAKIGIWKGSQDVRALDEEKVRFAFNTQCFVSTIDILGFCQFLAGPSWQLFGPSEIVEICRLGIGWETSIYELMLIGERKINMMRYFNAREGFNRQNDTLPEKIFKPLKGGPSDGVKLNKEEFENAKEIYYGIAGWDEEGNPTRGTLRKLSLGWLLENQN